MSATAVSGFRGSSIGTSPVSAGWIEKPSYDLALFTLAPLAGLVVILANYYVPGGYRLGIAATFLVAIPHYLSSFSFYLGDDNLEYYRTRKLAFFAGPVIIFGVVLLLRVIGYHRPVQSTLFVWNIYHVSMQSAGILSIYRRLNGGPAGERPVAHLAILSVNAAMAFWYIDRFTPLYELLVQIHPFAPWALRAVALPVAAGSLGIFLYRLARRDGPISLAEGSFLISSLLLFHPYLWVKDSQLATFGMLMGHFIQYLAIVWLLNLRKYAHSQGSRRQRTLGWISGRPTHLFGTLFAAGITFYLADKLTTALGAPMVYVVIWNAMTLIHFYLDGLVWAFKQPYVRQSIGPYLSPPSHIRAA
ncbi:MAG: hypothetical protein ACE5HT_02750 [Gemmatimonadales bacterium]